MKVQLPTRLSLPEVSRIPSCLIAAASSLVSFCATAPELLFNGDH